MKTLRVFIRFLYESFLCAYSSYSTVFEVWGYCSTFFSDVKTFLRRLLGHAQQTLDLRAAELDGQRRLAAADGLYRAVGGNSGDGAVGAAPRGGHVGALHRKGAAQTRRQRYVERAVVGLDGRAVFALQRQLADVHAAGAGLGRGGVAGLGGDVGLFGRAAVAGRVVLALSRNGAGDGFINIPDGIDEELPFN